MNVNEVVALFPEYAEKALVVLGYNTQNDISKVNQCCFHGKDYSVFFYCGELTYIENQGFGDIELVDGKIRFSLGITQFGKAKSSYWVIFIYESSEILNNDREIEGIVASLYGKDFLGKKVFTQEIHDNKSAALTPGFLSPYYRIATDIDESKFSNLSIFEDKLNSLGSTDKQSILRSLAWLSDSTKSYNADSFLRLWIALEIGFTKTDNAVKELRNRISKANDIENEEVDSYFCIGKLYGLRAEIVHRGKNPPIDGSILDVMFYIYTDLLFMKLTGQKDKRALNYLSEKQICFKEILDKCFA